MIHTNSQIYICSGAQSLLPESTTVNFSGEQVEVVAAISDRFALRLLLLLLLLLWASERQASQLSISAGSPSSTASSESSQSSSCSSSPSLRWLCGLAVRSRKISLRSSCRLPNPLAEPVGSSTVFSPDSGSLALSLLTLREKPWLCAKWRMSAKMSSGRELCRKAERKGLASSRSSQSWHQNESEIQTRRAH